MADGPELAMLGIGGDEGEVDPRTQLMRAMVLQRMQEGENGGGGGGFREGDKPAPSPGEPTPPGDPKAGRSFTLPESDMMESTGRNLSGFDETGMPTSFASTPDKEAAAARLHKAEASPDLAPWSAKKRALMGLAGMLPVAGPAIVGGELRQHHQARELVDQSRQDYHTEATLEQGQREQALRERVAMQNIEASKAMKTLMIGMQNRRTDVNAGVRHEGNEVAAAGKGYDLAQGPNGQEQVIPRQVNDLSNLVRSNIEVQQATEELRRAQATAVPQAIENKRKALDLANQHLQLALQNTQFNQDMKREGQDFRETGPTTQMRDRSQQAGVIDQTGGKLIQDIKDSAQHIGPIMGRYGSLTDFIGNPPPEYAGLAAELTTYIALQPAAHGFRGMRAVQEFEKSIGSPIRTPEALIAAIQGNMRGLGPMQQAGGMQWSPSVRAIPMAGGGPQLQRRPGAGATGATSGHSGGSRQVVRGPDGKLTF